jgi:hypothetical protein
LGAYLASSVCGMERREDGRVSGGKGKGRKETDLEVSGSP